MNTNESVEHLYRQWQRQQNRKIQYTSGKRFMCRLQIYNGIPLGSRFISNNWKIVSFISFYLLQTADYVLLKPFNLRIFCYKHLQIEKAHWSSFAKKTVFVCYEVSISTLLYAECILECRNESSLLQYFRVGARVNRSSLSVFYSRW